MHASVKTDLYHTIAIFQTRLPNSCVTQNLIAWNHFGKHLCKAWPAGIDRWWWNSARIPCSTNPIPTLRRGKVSALAWLAPGQNRRRCATRWHPPASNGAPVRESPDRAWSITWTGISRYLTGFLGRPIGQTLWCGTARRKRASHASVIAILR